MTFDEFSALNVIQMFGLDVSKTAFFAYEDKGVIPTAKRIQRGQSSYRTWDTSDLPKIGEAVGFLKKPTSPKVISVFSLKGGTGKTTFAFQLARTLALHNIRTLVVGLDAQESITQTLNRTAPVETEKDNQAIGLFHVLSANAKLKDCIRKTDLEALHYIPETLELSILDRWLKGRVRKEYVMAEQVAAPIFDTGNYDIILFDCNPSWSDTVTSALAATDILISPLGCDINSLKAASIFVGLLDEFQEEMRHTFERFWLVPTLAENNKLSQQILARYRLNYEDTCTVASIRRTVTVQEANVLGKSLMETASKTPVFQDFVSTFKEINAAMIETQAKVAAHGN